MSKQQVSSLDAVKRILSGGNMPGEKTRGDQRRYKLPNSTDEVRLRVLPQKDDPSFPMKISIYHYDIPGLSKGDKGKYENKNKNNDGKERGASVKCLQMYGIDCPICRTLKKYEGRLDLENWSAKVSGIANVLIKDDPTQRLDSRLPHLVYFSIGVIKWFEKIFESEDGPALVNINNGYDIIIHRKKYNGAFEIRNGLTASPLADTKDKIKDIMAQAYNLNEIIGKPDDSIISRCKDAAKFLDAEIENKILAASDGTGSDTADVPGVDPDEQIPEFSESNGETEAEGTEVAEEETAENESPAIVQHARDAKKTAAKTPPSNATAKGGTKTAPKAAAQEKPKEKAGAAKSRNASIAKPAGAPECYSDTDVYDEDSDKCLECPHQFHCENSIAAAKKG